VVETLRKLFSGELSAPDGASRQALFDRCVAGLNGEMGSSRIIDVMDEISNGGDLRKAPGPWNRVERGAIRFGLNVVRRLRSHLPGDHNKPEFQRHRFPGSTLEDMRERVARWQTVLDDRTPLQTEQIADHVFRITE
jgi:hypothetical protein